MGVGSFGCRGSVWSVRDGAAIWAGIEAAAITTGGASACVIARHEFHPSISARLGPERSASATRCCAAAGSCACGEFQPGRSEAEFGGDGTTGQQALQSGALCASRSPLQSGLQWRKRCRMRMPGHFV